MKPRNQFQREVFATSKNLHKLSNTQKNWIIKNCYNPIARRLKSGATTCLECGHEWEDSESVEGVICPHCQKQLLIEDTQKRSFDTIEYVSFITTCKGYQVIRMVYFEVKLKVGEKPYYFFKEVFQRWIAPNGKTVTIALWKIQRTLPP